MSDLFDLQRFVDAQDKVYDRVLDELRAGDKRTHWIWFVFPQIAGLGRSRTAQHYSLASLEEARAFLEHPVLGPRLRECTRTVLDGAGGTAEAIFGHPDWMKFRSSMTLFNEAQPDDVFATALNKYFGGDADSLTLEKLG